MDEPDRDLVLLGLWRGGDEAAGNRLLERHFPTLYRFFANKVASDVDDLVQQTMAGLLKSRELFENRSTFRAYLLSIARHHLYEFVRKRQRHNAILEFDSISVLDVSPSPSTLLAERREHSLLLKALRRIPLKFQVALELHYWEELSGPELAAALQVPLDTAYSRVRKARILVREQMRLLTEPARSRTTRDHASPRRTS